MSFNQMESKKRLTKLKNSIDSKIRQTPPTLTQSVKTLIDGYNKAAPQLEPKDVNFVDYDGTILYTYTFEEAKKLTTLPQSPDHIDDGLTFQGWNWTLDEVWQAENLSFIGAHYITNDKKTRLHLTIYDELFLSLCLTLSYGENGTVIDVDWGDGNKERVSFNQAKHVPHTYNTLGDYIITIDVLSGRIGFSSSIDTYGNDIREPITLQNIRSGHHNLMITNCITRMDIGKDVVRLGCASKNLERINIPIELTSLSVLNYKVLIIPKTLTSLPQFQPNMKILCLPFTTPYTTQLSFSDVSELQYFGFTPEITTLSISGKNSLTKLIIPDQINNLSTLTSCTKLRYLDIGKGVIVLKNGQFSSMNFDYILLRGDIEEIPYNCFASGSFIKILLPKSLKKIGNSSFAHSQILSIDFPENVTEIGTQCFNGSCVGYIKIHSKDFTFQNYAFQGSSYSVSNTLIDCTNAYIKEDGTLSYVFMTNVFQNADKQLKLIFANKEIADVAKVTTNLSAYANLITYVGEDEE